MATESALEANVRLKGKNSYYYAHAKRDLPEEPPLEGWDGREEPRLLQRQQSSGPTHTTEPIHSYAWSDGKKKVFVYIPLPGIQNANEHDVQLDWSEKELRLCVRDLQKDNVTRVLKLTLYDEISDATVKRKTDKITLVLSKREEVSWYKLVDSKE